MQTIQHATNLPYIPHYDMWNYAMEHPILFFIMTCFVVLITALFLEGFISNIYNLITNVINYKIGHK